MKKSINWSFLVSLLFILFFPNAPPNSSLSLSWICVEHEKNANIRSSTHPYRQPFLSKDHHFHHLPTNHVGLALTNHRYSRNVYILSFSRETFVLSKEKIVPMASPTKETPSAFCPAGETMSFISTFDPEENIMVAPPPTKTKKAIVISFLDEQQMGDKGNKVNDKMEAVPTAAAIGEAKAYEESPPYVVNALNVIFFDTCTNMVMKDGCGGNGGGRACFKSMFRGSQPTTLVGSGALRQQLRAWKSRVS